MYQRLYLLVWCLFIHSPPFVELCCSFVSGDDPSPQATNPQPHRGHLGPAALVTWQSCGVEGETLGTKGK